MAGPELERMYRLLAIANYEDRYVIPQAHAEQGAELMREQGACGLDFDRAGPATAAPSSAAPTAPRRSCRPPVTTALT